jgi:pilus assembly protein Flp/PilA
MNALLFKLAVALRCWADENGQDLIEYVLIGGVVGLAAIAGMNTLATDLNAAFSTIGGHISSNVT